jgi:8-oxo-dGTP diphosphatase
MVEIQLVVLTIADGRLRLLAGPRGLPSREPEKNESLDATAARLLREEVTADHLYLEQLYTFTFRGGRIVVGYLALVRNARIKHPDRKWHRAQPLPLLGSGHREVASYGVKRLRNKITYTNLAFAFLPDRFALSELQGVYEAVLDRGVDKRNFRKRILSLHILAPDGDVRRAQGRGGRPARLFRFTGPREVAFWPSFSPSTENK